MATFMTRMRTADKPCRPEGMTFPLEMAQLGAEAGLPPVGLLQQHLKVALGEIKLSEPAGAIRLIQEGVDVRQRLHERLRDGVEAPIVVADALRPVRFPSEHH